MNKMNRNEFTNVTIKDLEVGGKGLNDILMVNHATKQHFVDRCKDVAKEYGSIVSFTLIYSDGLGERYIFDGEYEYRRGFVVDK